MSKRWRIAAIVGGVGVAVGTVVPFLLPGSAGARGRSDIVAFDAAAILPPFKEGIATSARGSGIAASSLVEVAPAGEPMSKAGLVVGRGHSGDMVSFFTAHSFTNFRAVADAAKGEELTIAASIQPDAKGDTGHVQLLGIAAPDIAKTTLELQNGATLDVELVKAGSAGYSFFTYVSDDPATFPIVAYVYDASGVERQSRNLAEAIAPPR